MRDIPRAWYIVGGFVAVFLALSVIGMVAGDDDGGDDTVTVFYTVSDSGGGPVDLTFTNAGGNTEQITGAETTWERRFEMERGDFVSVSAQRGDGSGRVKCTITADNERIEQAESEGEFVIASCSGSIP